MAADTGQRSALENAAFVASFAGYVDVLSIQRETRGLMVEVLVNLEG